MESVHVMDANDRQMAPQNGRPHLDTNGRDMRGIPLQLTSGIRAFVMPCPRRRRRPPHCAADETEPKSTMRRARRTVAPRDARGTGRRAEGHAENSSGSTRGIFPSGGMERRPPRRETPLSDRAAPLEVPAVARDERTPNRGPPNTALRLRSVGGPSRAGGEHPAQA